MGIIRFRGVVYSYDIIGWGGFSFQFIIQAGFGLSITFWGVGEKSDSGIRKRAVPQQAVGYQILRDFLRKK